MLWRSQVKAAAVAILLVTTSQASAEQKLTAGLILEKMSSEQRFAYIAGVVEGLAHARLIADGNERSGHDCIFNWFYGGGASAKVVAAFRKYPNHYPGPIIHALTKPSCGG